LRNPHAGLRVFEVDHPATQAWKRECLVQAGLVLPDSLAFAPVDFESQTLADGLAAAGFDRTCPAFFLWLGVVPYLTHSAIASTLDFIAGIRSSEVVFGYSEPLENYPPERRARAEMLAARVAAIGEPWISHFDPPVLTALLRAKGFNEIEDLGPAAIARRFLGADQDHPDSVGAHVIRARRPNV
jgi:methyltransferase (TIGR00027 family)